MPSPAETQVLYRSDEVQICLVECRRPAGEWDVEEAADIHAIVLPLGGVFVKEVRGRSVTADVNHVVYFNRGEPYRVRHPYHGGDRCLVLALHESDLIEIAASRAPGVQDHPERPFEQTHWLGTARAALLRGCLLRALRLPKAAPVEIEETAVDLVEAALPAPPAAATAPFPEGRSSEIASAVQALLATRFRDRLRLKDIADAMDCSPFHLLRIFRRTVGIPIHRYHLRLRLRAAVERLADGERDLSRLAFDLGFADHAHFTHAFAREFGTTPSAFRRWPFSERLRRLAASSRPGA
jgi:AraC family transcriptional regulator